MTTVEMVAAYSRVAAAVRKAARTGVGLSGTDLRVLLAIYGNGGKASHHEARDLMGSGTGTEIRRSSLNLRKQGAITVAGVDGGPSRRGVVTMMALTDRGLALCEETLALAP